jgi:uncharacterized membrane protein YdcZ (DUF606 family)
MAAFLGISVWIALATVIPGLVTIAVLFLAIAIMNPDTVMKFATDLKGMSEWVYAGGAITIMVLTQSIGILVEKLFVRKWWYGPRSTEVEVPEGIDPLGATKFTLKPYAEYRGLYLLLAELREKEDSQGHLQRALAQFFLTNNTMVSFAGGLIFTVILLFQKDARDLNHILRATAYLMTLLACLGVSYLVARIRFEVMAKALWAARRRRITSPEKTPND